MIPGFGLIRRLIVAAVVLGALFVGGNVWVAGLAEERIASAIENNFDIDGVTVDIDDFPLLLHIFSGSIQKVSIRADDVTVEDVSMESLRVTLEGLEVGGGLLGGGELSVRVDEGSMSATTTQKGINEYLAARKERATVSLGDGRATVRATRNIAGAPRRIVASGRFALNKSKQILRFVPTRVTVDGRDPPAFIEAQAKKEATIEVKLPRLPGDIKADALDVRPGALTVSATFTDEELSITG